MAERSGGQELRLATVIPAMVMMLVAAACSSTSSGLPTAGGSRTALPVASTSAFPTIPPPSPFPSGAEQLGVPKPEIVHDPIPFPSSRRAEMRAYARRHYGLDRFRLVHPRVIVEHFTANQTYRPVFNTFAADSPRLGELPGTCSHFVIDVDGTIYQLVPLELMCRHTVGLNWTAIGIEMVGESDREILGRPRQLDAAISLTVWLMDRFDIELRNVIGHNESLTSPYHMERVRSLRCQTHQDWKREDMEVFRARVTTLARRFEVTLGPPAQPVTDPC
jgi:N-acetylmuramoyl-L-alanine amidase